MEVVLLVVAAVLLLLPQEFALSFSGGSSITSLSYHHRRRRRRRALSSSLMLRGGGGAETANKKLISFYILEGGMCPYAGRTWITLLELGLPFDYVEIPYTDPKTNPTQNPNMKPTKPQWFLDINPRGKVPALVNNKDGTTVYESAICDEYLSDLAREIQDDDDGHDGIWKLMPVNACDRAALRLLNDHVDTQLTPAVYTFLMNKEDDRRQQLIDELECALDVLQQSILNRGGSYLMGDEFSMADIHVLPFFGRMMVSLRHYKNYTPPKSKFNSLLNWFDLCMERSSVQTVIPSDDKILEVYERFVNANYSFGGKNRN